MSVSNTTVRQRFEGDGANKNFAIPFQFISGELSTINVYFVSELGILDLKTLGADYTLYPAGNNPTEVRFVDAPADEQFVLLQRELPIEQVLSYINTGDFLAEDHEKGLDRLVMLCQQLALLADNCIRLNVLDELIDMQLPPLEAPSANPSSGRVIAVNAALTGFEWGPTTEEVANAVTFAAAAAASAAAAAAAAASAESSEDAAQASELAAAASAAAALASEIAAAASAASMAASVAAAAASAAAALTSENNAETAETNAETAETNAAASAAAASASEVAAAASAAAAATLFKVLGSRAAPIAVTTGVTLPFVETARDTKMWITGNGGPVLLDAAPRIQAGSSVGQKLTLIGRSTINTVTLGDANGVDNGGLTHLFQSESIRAFVWDGSNWVFEYSNGI